MFALLDTLPGLSIVSVGHRPSLIPFHDTKLILANKGFRVESTGSARKRGHQAAAVEEEEKNGVSGGAAVAGSTDPATAQEDGRLSRTFSFFGRK